MTRLRNLSLMGAAFAAAAMLAPSAALAHGLVGKTDLPVAQWLFAWAAAVVLVASFVGLAAVWQRPRLQRVVARPVLSVPRSAQVACRALGVAAFVGLIYAGFAGAQDPQANILPTVVFVLFWVGIPFTSLLLGDVFAAFNPWRALGRAAGWLAARAGMRSTSRTYPEWLGRWPAAVGLLRSRGSSSCIPAGTIPRSSRRWRCRTPRSSSPAWASSASASGAATATRSPCGSRSWGACRRCAGATARSGCAHRCRAWSISTRARARSP